MSNDAIIIAVFSGIGLIIGACATAWVTLRKSRMEVEKVKVETDKAVRDDVIDEWRVITDRLQTTIKEQDTEIKALRTEVRKLYEEVAALRVQMVARETERVEQRGDIRKLEKHITELKSGDVAPTPVVIVQAKDASPVRVTDQGDDEHKEGKP